MTKRSRIDALLVRASEQWDKGKLLSAFRLFLSAAKANDSGAQLNLGYFYRYGIGIKPNRIAALYWYTRAYRRGMGSAASNIGIIYRDEQNYTEALKWFRRAIELKDVDANLQIAKIYLKSKDGKKRAIRHLKRICDATIGQEVVEASQKEARHLLKKLANNS